jgi:predicted dehydrogenase
MDTGCYAIHLLRHLAGAEPEVLRAQAIMQSPEVDRRVEADLRFPDGRSGRVVCSLFSRTLLRADARVLGSAGEMRVLNPIAPHLYHRLRVRTPQGQRSEKVNGEATYTHQLRAFVHHVRGEAAVPTGPDDAVANMRVIDAIYEAAGLSKRGALS